MIRKRRPGGGRKPTPRQISIVEAEVLQISKVLENITFLSTEQLAKEFGKAPVTIKKNIALAYEKRRPLYGKYHVVRLDHYYYAAIWKNQEGTLRAPLRPHDFSPEEREIMKQVAREAHKLDILQKREEEKEERRKKYLAKVNAILRHNERQKQLWENFCTQPIENSWEGRTEDEQVQVILEYLRGVAAIDVQVSVMNSVVYLIEVNDQEQAVLMYATRILDYVKTPKHFFIPFFALANYFSFVNKHLVFFEGIFQEERIPYRPHICATNKSGKFEEEDDDVEDL